MKQPVFQFGDAVPGLGGLFKGEGFGLFAHFLFEAGDFGFQALRVGVLGDGVFGGPFGGLALAAGARAGVGALHDIEHGLADAGRGDAVFAVEGELALAAAVRFVDGAPHRAGYGVGVQYGPAVEVAGGAADGLDQRAVRAQEAFLVGVEHGD